MSCPTDALHQAMRQSVPIEEAAAKWLPWDWRDSSRSSLLALALWGITDGGLGRGHHSEEIEEAIVRLGLCHPSAAGSWIKCLSMSDDEVVLTVEHLRAAGSTEDAAVLVIDAILGHLVEGKPFPPRATPLGT